MEEQVQSGILNQEQSDKIIMPSENIKEDSELMNTEFGSNMLGDTVSRLNIKKEDGVELPNYILDYSKVKKTNIFQRNAIRSLVSKSIDDGDCNKTALYLYTDDRILKIGYIRTDKAARSIATFRNFAADNDVRVFKDVTDDGYAEEVKHRDITKLRLSL